MKLNKLKTYKAGIKATVAMALTLVSGGNMQAQGIHFSQYYNAPLLVNPANTALMSENDYRLGLNYRNQWNKVPVPFKTVSAFADMQAFRAANETNWMGIGFAFFNDVAGDGNLTLNRGDVFLAYHVQTNDNFMISAGLSAGYGSRNVNYDKLTFNEQWNAGQFKFDRSLPNGEMINGTEMNNIIKTNYLDIGAGVNFAYFPNELIYVKLGAGVAHVNTPTETFYNMTNEIGIRPSVNLDGQFVIAKSVTLNPSVYYTTQQGAYQIVGGTLVYVYIGDGSGSNGNSSKTLGVIAGGHYRYKEAFIGSLGLEYVGLKFMTSYDYTTSTLSPENNGNGAFEFSIIYTGKYGERRRSASNMNCPRF
jgi:type IX secretion system PorP/SprF family membrane protein